MSLRLASAPLQRLRFTGSSQPLPSLSPQTLLQLLLHQDGSTTRLLEQLAGQRITVHVLQQEAVAQLPPALAGALPGRSFLRRVSTLELGGQVLLDSLAYIAVDAVGPAATCELLEGVRPIGHVLAASCTRREFRRDDAALLDELWAEVGQPDPQAARSTRISTPAGPCMVLAEVFRGGVLTLASWGEPAEPAACSAPGDAAGFLSSH